MIVYLQFDESDLADDSNLESERCQLGDGATVYDLRDRVQNDKGLAFGEQITVYPGGDHEGDGTPLTDDAALEEGATYLVEIGRATEPVDGPEAGFTPQG